MGTYIVIGALFVGLAVFFVGLSLFPFATYVKCLSAGVPASPFTLIAMKLRNVPADLIIDIQKHHDNLCECGRQLKI